MKTHRLPVSGHLRAVGAVLIGLVSAVAGPAAVLVSETFDASNPWSTSSYVYTGSGGVTATLSRDTASSNASGLVSPALKLDVALTTPAAQWGGGWRSGLRSVTNSLTDLRMLDV